MKKSLLFLLVISTLTSVLAQSPQKGPLKELKQRHTLNSKTFYNQRNDTYTTRISAGYLHYRDENGKLKEINTNIRFNKDGSFRVDRGLYKARFNAVSSQKNKYDVTYELPRPVKGRKPKPRRGKGPTTRLQWRILSLGYFDRQSKNYTVVQKAQPVAAVTSGRTVTYPEIFPGVAVRFANDRTKLKEDIVLSQQARDALPNPTKFGIAAEDAFLMVASELKLTPNNIKVFARKPDKSKSPVKRGSDFSFEGSDRIEFSDDDNVLHFFFPQDFAWAEADTAHEKRAVRRFFYSERGKHFLLAGVPWRWVQAQPKGTLVIDPSTAATTTEDVWLEDGNNQNGNAFLIVGKAANYPKKRTVIKFDVAGAGVPSGATIVKAQMNLKYYEKANVGGTAWVDRTVQAHQLLVDWGETQATRDNRLTSTPWNVQYGAIDGSDAKATPESSVWFVENETLPRWKQWDLTALTKQWWDGSVANYGVILWATNEDTDGYDLRFHSSEAASVYDQPYLQVIWTEPVKTVYFLKDHLGSIRATVDDIGQVVGYDDYDPWGYILAGRSMATGASTVQGAAKHKFTGKEWDDEFGLNVYHFPARPYDPETGRWMVPDPLAEKFPGWSPYNYTLNNPVNNFDPDGREVRFADSTKAAMVAEAINKENEGANVGVEKRQTEEVSITVFGKKITLKKSETYYALTSDPSSGFDWAQNEITQGLYDVINSQDIVFNAKITDKYYGDIKFMYGADIETGFGGGFIDPKKGGGTLWFSERHSESLGVRFMHEAVGHGHPAGRNNATRVNQLYNNRFEPGHYGYHKVIGWKQIGLYRLWQAQRRSQKVKHY